MIGAGLHLKCGNIKVRCCNVDEVVLNHVDKCRNRHADTVPRLMNYILVEMSAASTHRHAFLVPDDDKTCGHLQYLRHDDGRCRRKHVAWTRPDVAHDDNERCILYRQQHEADVLQMAWCNGGYTDPNAHIHHHQWNVINNWTDKAVTKTISNFNS